MMIFFFLLDNHWSYLLILKWGLDSFFSCSAFSLKYKLHKVKIALYIIFLVCVIAVNCTWYWCTFKLNCCTSVVALSFLKHQKITTGRVECEFSFFGFFYSVTLLVLSMVDFRQSYVAFTDTHSTLLSNRLLKQDCLWNEFSLEYIP